QDPNNLLTIQANWNGHSLAGGATTTLPLNQTGIFSWQSQYDASNTELATYLPTISNATYTLQLYKGTVGNSILVHSETISYGNASSSSSFSFAFPGAGPYFLAYTATYPDGEYPLGATDSCRGDVCLLPQYPLQHFQDFVTSGQFQNEFNLYMSPALWG